MFHLDAVYYWSFNTQQAGCAFDGITSSSWEVHSSWSPECSCSLCGSVYSHTTNSFLETIFQPDLWSSIYEGTYQINCAEFYNFNFKRAYLPTMPDDSLFHAMNVLAGKYYGKFTVDDLQNFKTVHFCWSWCTACSIKEIFRSTCDCQIFPCSEGNIFIIFCDQGI